MSSPPHSADSPRGPALPTHGLLQPPQGMPTSSLPGALGSRTECWMVSGDSSERATVDRSSSASLGNLLPSSPYNSVRNEQRVVPTSTSAPSLLALLATRSFPPSPSSRDARPLTEEGSNSQSSSQQRVAFGGRASAPTPNHSPRTQVQAHPLLRETVSQARGIDSMVTGLSRSSEPTRPPSVLLSPSAVSSPKKSGHESPPTASARRSRTTSPLPRFGWSPFHHAREDPFIPVDPFRLRTRLHRLALHGPDIENPLSFDPACEDSPFCCVTSLHCHPKDRLVSFLRDARYFIFDTLLRQIYLHLLLRLPSLYFSRIARVYEDAQLSKPDLDRMIDTYSSSRQQEQRQRIITSSPIPPGAHYHPAAALPFPDEWTTTNVSPALIRFKQSWEAFIDSLLREWKTLNLVSALLHSALITMFQSQIMANDPIIRTAALLSLSSALMSLSYGCIYIVRFGTMRSMYKATRWAEEAARTTPFIVWNVWVLLAMPAVWLSWSMIFFIVAILAYVWRYGSSADPTSPPLLSPTAAIGPRIAVSALFFLGLIYLIAIVKTLHNYGRSTENRLSRRIITGNELPDMPEDNTRREEQGNQRERDRDYGQDSTRVTRGREPTRGRRGQDATEPGGLSAVTGLGLTGLDEFANTRGLEEVRDDKQLHQTEASA